MTAPELSRARRVAVVVDRYPCLSESFVRRELAQLERRGAALAIVVCARERSCDLWLESDLDAQVFRADRRASQPRQGLEGSRDVLRGTARASALFPQTPRGLLRAARAASIAGAIRSPLADWRPDWLHAHFLGMPAVVGCLLGDALGVPLSLSAHAHDVFVPAIRFDAVCARARFIAACSRHAHATLAASLPPAIAARIVDLPHGVACEPAMPDRARRSGGALRLLSVCRLVPKKGIDVVLRALPQVGGDVPYRYRIVGDGPELPRLRAMARAAGLDAVEFVGAKPPSDVAAELAAADLFVLGARTAPDGDRDGIPNALLEAMAAGVPVVASDAGGVAEVVEHRVTGWMTPSDDPRAFAAAIREAALDEALRRAIARRAHAEVRQRFSVDVNADALWRRLSWPEEGTMERNN
jgi:glycosyltransferase involved in cell wall biosynthesis